MGFRLSFKLHGRQCDAIVCHVQSKAESLRLKHHIIIENQIVIVAPLVYSETARDQPVKHARWQEAL